MRVLKNLWIGLNVFRTYTKGYLLLSNPVYSEGKNKVKLEKQKDSSRTEAINFILSTFDKKTTYLEIGTRKPSHNFDHIEASTKYSVDPGVEYKKNPVDFQLTSDSFFEKLNNGEILSENTKFDVIFIDGLHLAEQAFRDVKNSLEHLSEGGFIVIHDCNPPTEWHAREDYYYRYSPAGTSWNGTTWKAFLKWRSNSSVYSCCIDTDWGLGIISKKHAIGKNIDHKNTFYEFSDLNENRKEYLNLMNFDEFKQMISQIMSN